MAGKPADTDTLPYPYGVIVIMQNMNVNNSCVDCCQADMQAPCGRIGERNTALARARLKDIAEQLGVSTNTVSLALRGSPLVATDTKAKIVDAARLMGYRPNEIAKSLVRKQSRTVGLLLTNIVNPTLTQTAQAAETALKARGYATLFATSNNSIDNEMQALEVFLSRQVDGILLYPSNHSRLDHIVALREARTPMVLMAGESHSGLDSVSLDERLGAEMLTDYLLGLGHRRIGMIDSGTLMGNPDKVAGYRAALEKWDVPFAPELLQLRRGASARSGREGVAELIALEQRPTAIFCSNDMIAIGAMDACVGMGLGVPGDISIAGFDDIEFAAYAKTPLTSVNNDPGQFAARAVERLLFLIESEEAQPAVIDKITPSLKLRQSTAAPLLKD